MLLSQVEEESLGAAFHEMGVGMKNVTFLTDRETGEFYGSAFATFETPDDAAMAVACTGMKVLGRPVNIKFAEKPVKKQSVGAKALQMRELAPRPSGGTHKAFFGNLDYGIDVSEHAACVRMRLSVGRSERCTLASLSMHSNVVLLFWVQLM